jgi:hypothetical protein
LSIPFFVRHTLWPIGSSRRFQEVDTVKKYNRNKPAWPSRVDRHAVLDGAGGRMSVV